jgi:pimeloyl-ACP methyl ester carboxylesterase
MKTLKKTGAWCLAAMSCLLVMLGIGGFIYQSAAQSSDLARWPAPGKLIDVDGDRMHLYCQGEGSPTIVVEQGTGGYYDHWDDMNRTLSQLTRVCAYDRAGMGYSDSLGRPVGSAEIAARLHKLLSAADITDDLILVGWSAGGIYVRDYYAQFPDKVAGMILVDSSHEQQQSRMADVTPPSGFDVRRVLAYLQPFGVVRLSGLVDQVVAYEPGSDAHKQRTKVVYNQSHWARAYFAEADAFDIDQQANRRPPSLGDLPLTVLSRGKEVAQSEQEHEKIWQELQKELAALSTQGRQVIAGESGHSIHLDQSELIFAVAQEMLLKARASQDIGKNEIR